MVKYEKGVIFVEHNGTIVNRFTKIRTLDVYNKIEGYLTFFGGSTSPGRTFPGYGELSLLILIRAALWQIQSRDNDIMQL